MSEMPDYKKLYEDLVSKNIEEDSTYVNKEQFMEHQYISKLKEEINNLVKYNEMLKDENSRLMRTYVIN
jgi:DNA-binding protein H-NS